jgi:tRNA(adenine34) deaminase
MQMIAMPTTCRCCHRLDRRRAVAALFWTGFGALSQSGAAWARATKRAARDEDERFMRLALGEAAHGDLPFGAVIVKDGRVLATGRNEGRTVNDPTAHAEMMAIRQFVAKNPAKDLAAATIYSTGEPCPMCMAAIIWSGFGRVVFAATIGELSEKIGQIAIPSADVAAAASFVDI